jgi:hypothetical protein
MVVYRKKMGQPVLYPQFFDHVVGCVDGQSFQKGYEQLIKESRCKTVEGVILLAKNLLCKEKAVNDLARIQVGLCNITKYYEIVKKTDNFFLGHLYRLIPNLFEHERKDLQSVATSFAAKIESITLSEKDKKSEKAKDLIRALTEKELEFNKSNQGYETIRKLIIIDEFRAEAKEALKIISDLGRGPALPQMQTIRKLLLTLQTKYEESKTFETFAAVLLCGKEYVHPLVEQLVKIREDEPSLIFSITPSDVILEEAITFRMLAAAFRFCVGDTIADSVDLFFEHFLGAISNGLRICHSRVFSSYNFYAPIIELMNNELFSNEVGGIVFRLSSVNNSEPVAALVAMVKVFIELSQRLNCNANDELLIAALLTEKYSLPCFIQRMKQGIEKEPKIIHHPICKFFCNAIDFCCGIDPRNLAEIQNERSDELPKVRLDVLREINRRTLSDKSLQLLSDRNFVKDAKQLFADFLYSNPLGGIWTKREQFIRQYWDDVVRRHCDKIGINDLQTYGADDDLVLVETTIMAAPEIIPEIILKMKALDDEIIGKPRDSQEYSFMNFYWLLIQFSQTKE